MSSDSGVCSCEVLRDCTRKSMSEVEPRGGPVLNDLETNSMYPVSGGRLKTDRDVERLKERPRTVQEKEKPSFSTEEGERVNAHFKLFEEIAKHLPRVSESDNSTRKVHLQPSSSKVGSDENRSSDASSEPVQIMCVLIQKL